MEYLKQAVKYVLKVKYLAIFTVIYAISNIFDKVISYNFKLSEETTAIITLFSVMFSFVAIGFLINNIHKLVNNDENDYDSFKIVLWDSIKNGIKILICYLSNFIFLTIILSVMIMGIMFIFKKILPQVISPLIVITAIFIFLFALYLFTAILIVFAKNYKIKKTFNWIYLSKLCLKNFKKVTTVIICYLMIIILTSAIFLLNINLPILLFSIFALCYSAFIFILWFVQIVLIANILKNDLEE